MTKTSKCRNPHLRTFYRRFVQKPKSSSPFTLSTIVSSSTWTTKPFFFSFLSLQFTFFFLFTSLIAMDFLRPTMTFQHTYKIFMQTYSKLYIFIIIFLPCQYRIFQLDMKDGLDNSPSVLHVIVVVEPHQSLVLFLQVEEGL